MIFVLVVAVFFYSSTGHAPEVVHRIYATPAECVAAKATLIEKAEANSKVESASGICLGVRAGEKT